MSEVTRLLNAVEQGDPKAAEQLLPLVYDELRRLAAHRMAGEVTGQTVHTLKGHDERLYAAQFSPDGKTIATAAAWMARSGCGMPKEASFAASSRITIKPSFTCPTVRTVVSWRPRVLTARSESGMPIQGSFCSL
jgi:hypothetical protein